MPLFELFGDSSRRKLDSSQEKITDLSLIPESDFAELIWENGQLMMQGGQSSRGRKNPSLPSYYNSPSQSPKHSRDRVDASNNGDGNGISSSSGRFRTFGSCPNEFAAEMCDDEGDDDIVPWFNCPINDFLPDLSGITENLDSLKKNNNESNFHPRANDGVSQVPFPSHRPKGSEATGSGMTSTTSNAAAGAEDTNRFPNSGNNFVNFSHFSRPKFVNRSTACNNSVIPDSGPSDMERVVFSSKQEGPSAEMKHANGSKSMEANQTDQPPCSEGIRPKDVLKINGIRDENGGAGSSRDPQETVVASSVCSGNGLDGGASDDPICNLKRKSRDTYDSEAPSDDIGEDSVGLRKAGSARGNSSKRGRAAEVHNLSERRRRDRINEKMRALQELIPNCNKVDKASMLDEAIEYLKTLQIQVQIMSMGAGMYMPPPMMFPGGMHPAHIAQIQAMGVGMASGLGFRMGMVEPNSGMGSSGFPMMQIPPPPPPPMQGSAHFPSPYMSGHPAMHGAVLGTNYPVIGVPGPPMSMQRPPMIPFAGAAPVQRPASALHNNASMEPMAVAAATTTTASKEPMAIAADAAAVGCSTNPPPTQGQGRNGGGLERSPSVQFSMNPGDDSS